MPFDAYVVYDSADNNLIRGYGLTQAQADARAAEDADWMAHTGQVTDIPDSAVSGSEWFFNATTSAVGRVAQTVAGTIAERRALMKSICREKERIDGLAAWTAGELNDSELLDDRHIGERGKSYARWVEMLTRASAVDINLSNDVTWAVVFGEASIPSRVWYWLHHVGAPENDDILGEPWSGFNIFSMSDRTTWAWYTTQNNGVATPNSRGGVADGRVIIGPLPGADFNWIAYLG